ncbi:MAG: MFS transporter [Pseudomonadota bacterium]
MPIKLSLEQKITLCIVSIAVALVFIDMTVFSITLPAIQRHFSATRHQGFWIVNIYLMITATLTLATGKISDYFGHQRIFSIGTLVFIAASFLCGIAMSIKFLLFARALQSFGAAFILIAGMSLIATSFSDENRGRATGIAMGFATFMMTIAPFIGGIIIQWLNWRWIFFMNVFLGLLISYFLIKQLFTSTPATQSQTKSSFDYFGFISITSFTVSIILACQNSPHWGWFNTKTVLAIIIAIVSLVIFIVVEKKQANPLIDFELFKLPNYRPGCLIMALSHCINYFVIFAGVFLQTALGYKPFITALLLLPAGLLLAIFSNVGGYLADKLGARIPMIAGTGLLTAGLLLSTLTIKSMSYMAILPTLIAYGIGICLLSNPLRTSMLRHTAKEKYGMANSILSGTRQIGGAIGFAIVSSVISYGEKISARHQLLAHIPNLSIAKIDILLGILTRNSNSMVLLKQFTPAQQTMMKQIILQSYVHSFTIALVLLSVIMLICFLISILFIKR